MLNKWGSKGAPPSSPEGDTVTSGTGQLCGASPRSITTLSRSMQKCVLVEYGRNSGTMSNVFNTYERNLCIGSVPASGQRRECEIIGEM